MLLRKVVFPENPIPRSSSLVVLAGLGCSMV